LELPSAAKSATRKGFFEANWDRLVMGGPWVGYGVVALITPMAEFGGVAIAFSAVFGTLLQSIF